MRLYYNADNSYLFVNRKEIFKFKADNKNVNCPTQFCLRSISNGFSAIEPREASLNGNAYDISVHCNSIDNSGILNIQKYLMNKDNIKKCSVLLKKLFILLLTFSSSLARN